jgi:phosphatidylinositol phospholipase C beta
LICISQNLAKKQLSELEKLRKKHLKEKQTIQKIQCLSVEKLLKTQNGVNNNNLVNDPIIKELVLNQVKQWSEMLERHRKNEWQLAKEHYQQQGDNRVCHQYTNGGKYHGHQS